MPGRTAASCEPPEAVLETDHVPRQCRFEARPHGELPPRHRFRAEELAGLWWSLPSCPAVSCQPSTCRQQDSLRSSTRAELMCVLRGTAPPAQVSVCPAQRLNLLYYGAAFWGHCLERCCPCFGVSGDIPGYGRCIGVISRICFLRLLLFFFFFSYSSCCIEFWVDKSAKLSSLSHPSVHWLPALNPTDPFGFSETGCWEC